MLHDSTVGFNVSLNLAVNLNIVTIENTFHVEASGHWTVSW